MGNFGDFECITNNVGWQGYLPQCGQTERGLKIVMEVMMLFATDYVLCKLVYQWIF